MSFVAGNRKISEKCFLSCYKTVKHLFRRHKLTNYYLFVGRKGKIKMKKSKKKIAFICVHNSCRSQIAEAVAKHFLGSQFDFYSAGTETKPQINQDAVRLVKKIYGIDMEKTQYSKLISDIPSVDVAISMGCNVACPFIGRDFDGNWQLEDPTGKSDEEFIKVIEEIEDKILNLEFNL